MTKADSERAYEIYEALVSLDSLSKMLERPQGFHKIEASQLNSALTHPCISNQHQRYVDICVIALEEYIANEEHRLEKEFKEL